MPSSTEGVCASSSLASSGRGLIRLATASDANALVDLMTDAFSDDPLVGWLCQERPRARRRYAQMVVEQMTLPLGACWMSEAGDAAALWMPPGSREAGAWEQLRLVPQIARIVGWTRLGVTSRVSECIELERPPHYWYLALVGVRSTSRGQGLGRRVLLPGMQSADVAVLDTSVAANVGFYSTLGFEVTREFTPPEAPRMWTMQRGSAANLE